MNLIYWEQMAEAERRTESAADAREQASASNIINIETVLEEKRIRDEEELSEIEEILNEPARSGAGRVFRMIFVDTLLGIPFLVICLLLISALIAVTAVLSVIFAELCIVCLIAGLGMIGYGIGSLFTTAHLGLMCMGPGFVLTALSIGFLMLGLLLGFKAVPKIAKWYSALVKKLNLYR